MRKKVFFRKLFLGVVASLGGLIFLLAGCGNSSSSSNNQSSVSAIKKRGVLRVAVFGDLKPYGWVNQDANASGMTSL